MKINILGASGAGTTTLAKYLSQKEGWKHLDADGFYWEKTKIPFQKKVPIADRNRRLQAAMRVEEPVVLSGSLGTWGSYWDTAFDWVVFLQIPPELRMQRLRKREQKRYGDKLLTDPIIQKQSEDFLAWAAQYDRPGFDGRSLGLHNRWLAGLTCPVLRIEGEIALEAAARRVLEAL